MRKYWYKAPHELTQNGTSIEGNKKAISSVLNRIWEIFPTWMIVRKNMDIGEPPSKFNYKFTQNGTLIETTNSRMIKFRIILIEFPSYLRDRLRNITYKTMK